MRSVRGLQEPFGSIPSGSVAFIGWIEPCTFPRFFLVPASGAPWPPAHSAPCCWLAVAPAPNQPLQPPRRRATVPQNWTGTYRGTVPCTPPSTPACTSQQLALTLLPGNTYELETTVQRRGQPYTIV